MTHHSCFLVQNGGWRKESSNRHCVSTVQTYIHKRVAAGKRVRVGLIEGEMDAERLVGLRRGVLEGTVT